MSGEIAPRQDAALSAAAADRNPLRLVPKEFRKPVAFFWSLNQHLLPTALPLAARLQLWIAREGLSADDVKEVLARLAAPERAARHQFAGQLLADLAAEVAEQLRRKRLLGEVARRRKRDAVDQEEAAPPDEVKAMIDTLFGDGRTHPEKAP